MCLCLCHLLQTACFLDCLGVSGYGAYQVRRNAAHALGRIGAPAAAAVHQLAQALCADEDLGVRRHAALALGELGELARPVASK